jgi:hypothetical protein
MGLLAPVASTEPCGPALGTTTRGTVATGVRRTGSRPSQDALNLLASWTLTQNRPVDERTRSPALPKPPMRPEPEIIGSLGRRRRRRRMGVVAQSSGPESTDTRLTPDGVALRRPHLRRIVPRSRRPRSFCHARPGIETRSHPEPRIDRLPAHVGARAQRRSTNRAPGMMRPSVRMNGRLSRARRARAAPRAGRR